GRAAVGGLARRGGAATAWPARRLAGAGRVRGRTRAAYTCLFGAVRRDQPGGIAVAGAACAARPAVLGAGAGGVRFAKRPAGPVAARPLIAARIRSTPTIPTATFRDRCDFARDRVQPLPAAAADRAAGRRTALHPPRRRRATRRRGQRGAFGRGR